MTDLTKEQLDRLNKISQEWKERRNKNKDIKVGDMVKFKHFIPHYKEIGYIGEVHTVIPYGLGSYLVIECYCVVDYCLFMKYSTEVEVVDAINPIT